MCDFGVTTRRLLTIPPNFVPYMEKHRLYEFFYELVTQLLIQKPEDPLVFMKQCIQYAIRKRDIPRIILIAPPSFGNSNSLTDIPRSKKEARAMQRVGVIPTHVIQIVSSNAENETQSILTVGSVLLTLLFCSCSFTSIFIFFFFKHSEVEVGVKTIQELGKECATLSKIKKHYGAPSLFRIALIGPRGSGHHSLAKHISERFNLVHVDFNYILEQACSQETALGEMLRLCECYGYGKKLKSETRIEIVEQYVLGSECLRKGWILTDYPKTVEEFKLLDMISTPPNRVIILKVDAQKFRERLLNRRSNLTNGSERDLASCETLEAESAYELDAYPKDYDAKDKDVIEQDLREYEENIKDIMQYAGETASVIDAMDEEKRVQEKLEACLMRSAPSAKPRIPQIPPPIDPMDIEFDPDDEPDPKIFDDIRTPEPKYSFI
ncbi:adenylate kinase 8 [Cataglyphis hispanica]|uniref:adenylate kinase 8 n=1 Tax=Cataglyphis hispanica TaxID=1086592 RepID=UPI002180460F|nr:adenylate kinase 8 [Cataglyphis hispanica]